MCILVLATQAPVTAQSKGQPASRQTKARDRGHLVDLATLRQQITTALKAGELDKADAILRSAHPRVHAQKGGAKPEERGEWWLLEARLEFAREQYPEAGLAAMRIVALLPESKRVADGWYWAGRAYEKMNRPEKANQLFKKCFDRAAPESDLQKKARARLTAHQKKAGPR